MQGPGTGKPGASGPSLQQVQRGDVRPVRRELAEKRHVRRERQPREIHPQKLRIPRTVAGAVKDGVGVVKHILRPEGLLQIPRAIAGEAQPELRRKLRGELWREVRAASRLGAFGSALRSSGILYRFPFG